jgi:hypothetical protein
MKAKSLVFRSVAAQPRRIALLVCCLLSGVDCCLSRILGAFNPFLVLADVDHLQVDPSILRRQMNNINLALY